MSFTCQFCSKTFQRERTLSAHLCEQKRRWLNKDEKYVVLGFLAFRRFYEISMGEKKEKTYDQFSSSQYYTAFTKFGRHMLNINAVDPESFIDFVIRSSISVDKWCNETVYETYIHELNKKETAERALERGIILMQEWGNDNDKPFNVFFRDNSRSRIIHWIRSGRISPWIIFNCDSGVELLSEFNDQELKLVNDYMDPDFWTRKFQVRKNDVNFVRNVLEKAGL
jgi:hypothetical protein